jgi:hypothetical protein
MSTTPGYAPGSDVGVSRQESVDEGRGGGWLVFAGIILLVAGVLNVIYGIAGISKSHFFVANAHYVFSDLKGWGWITLILGVLQLTAAFSLFAGGTWGRVYGIAAASLAAIGALLSIPAYPFLSLALFALAIMVIYGLASYEGNRYSV